MTAAYCFEPEFCRREFHSDELSDLRATIKLMATDEYTYPKMLSELADADYLEALQTGSYDLNESIAFSKTAQTMVSYKWAEVFMAPWPALRFAAMRLLALACSASGFEHSWSVEGWIHSKKRNRLGQKTVERLLRTHTNLLISGQLEEWQDAVLRGIWRCSWMSRMLWRRTSDE